MKTTPETRKLIDQAMSRLKTAATAASRVRASIQDAARIADSRRAQETELMESFEPGNDKAVSELAFCRSSAELHSGLLQRLVNIDAPATLTEVQAAVDDARTTLREAAEVEREALFGSICNALKPFGGLDIVDRGVLEPIPAGRLAAEHLPALAELPNGNDWPSILYIHADGPSQAVNRIADAEDACRTLLEVGKAWISNGGFAALRK